MGYVHKVYEYNRNKRVNSSFRKFFHGSGFLDDPDSEKNSDPDPGNNLDYAVDPNESGSAKLLLKDL